MTVAFQVGKTYTARFMSNYDTVVHATIVSRTQKTVKVKLSHREKIRLFRVGELDGKEYFRPFGNHSMAMVIYADSVETSNGEMTQ